MLNILYREATDKDIPLLAKIRSENWETEVYWKNRISAYLNYTNNPQQSLKARVIYVVCDGDKVIGFIAGHLANRYNCEGELEWIDVIEEYRRKGIASELVKLLAKWFIEQKSFKICIDPGNDNARLFYKKNGAEMLNNHWMYWKDIRTIL
jgi:ribosomal protein S18 acetylase RimI-like enzyme